MRDKLKLLDLGKNYTIKRADNEDYYIVEQNNGNFYAYVNDDGSIEYWGDTGEYYDFKIDLDKLKDIVEFINVLKVEEK